MVVGMDPKLTLSDGYKALRINPDDLDQCLCDQPDLFYHVGHQYVLAVGRRDQLKMEYENQVADLDKAIRQDAARKKRKLTEKQLDNLIRLEVGDAYDDYLKARLEAEKWLVLKESYQQRSFMLRELVARQIAQMQTLGIERGTASSRGQLADASFARMHNERIKRRSKGGG